MSFDYDQKRALVIANLIGRTFGASLEHLSLVDHGVRMRFKNKLRQPVMCCFALIDTWDKVKQKIEKLEKSDGVCVVCFKNEKMSSSAEKKNLSSNTCDTCCEFICRDCATSCIKSKHEATSDAHASHLCPVCRSCLMHYRQKVHNQDCQICEGQRFSDEWTAYIESVQARVGAVSFETIDQFCDMAMALIETKNTVAEKFAEFEAVKVFIEKKIAEV
jgi:hypothetical protein